MTAQEHFSDVHIQEAKILRNVLFLQGPASPFLRRLASEIESRGGSVRKINFCLGDAAFWWPRRGDWFIGPAEKWPGYLENYLTRHCISDIVMLGDGRHSHAAAITVGMERGCRIHILEHGYLRPDWLTLEPDGMSGASRFPRQRHEIEPLAAGKPEPDLAPRYRSSFLIYALYDLVYHLPNVLFGWFIHPRYRTHGPVHPLIEYGGWIKKAVTVKLRRRAAARAVEACIGSAEATNRYFLFPLQLPGDYQIKVHAPSGDLFALVEATIKSFAANASGEARLLFKIHPIDNGLSHWDTRIGAMASRYDVNDRVFVADGGDLNTLIQSATGVVTVNSTVGLSALIAGRPVIALGAAIYDVDGLTHQSSLASFWNAPVPPQPGFVSTFIRALAASMQVRGGFIGHDAIREGAANAAALLMEEKPRLPSSRAPAVARFRYAQELEARASDAAGEMPPASMGVRSA